MNKIIELNTHFYSGHYEEFNEFQRTNKIGYISHGTFLNEVYKFVRVSNKVAPLYKVTDEEKFTIFMLKYPQFIENISYET